MEVEAPGNGSHRPGLVMYVLETTYSREDAAVSVLRPVDSLLVIWGHTAKMPLYYSISHSSGGRPSLPFGGRRAA